MEFSIPDCFMLGLLLGLCFAPVYEALRIVRLIFRFKFVVIACDILFFVLAGEAVFRLSLVLGNHIRGYTIAGFGAGIFAYIVTLGRVLNAAESGAAVLWRKTVGRLAKRCSDSIRRGFGAIAQNAKAFFGKVADFFAAGEKKLKEGLILSRRKSYNNKTDINNGGNISNVIQAHIRRSP